MDLLQEDFFEIDETVGETPRPPVKALIRPPVTIVKVPVPVRRHRIITHGRIGHATSKGRAEFAAARLAGELSVKPNLAMVCREFGTYPRVVKTALAALRGNNNSVPESLLSAEWRRASPADREAFVAENAVVFVAANPNAILAAIDRITTP